MMKFLMLQYSLQNQKRMRRNRIIHFKMDNINLIQQLLKRLQYPNLKVTLFQVFVNILRKMDKCYQQKKDLHYHQIIG
ncbi:unnamed protein product [Paramecium sonneborni]|uniref:Uncharacterized protein n=1 Tax=Paramecium sonneborni TaxID=65129 RepID=A0A8S1L0D9_9CILI|nr:unnamed protein product [Paramecium sonneborni]